MKRFINTTVLYISVRGRKMSEEKAIQLSLELEQGGKILNDNDPAFEKRQC